MFTGIVEELGRLQSIQHSDNKARLRIQAQKVLSDIRLGDSIAINGVCQTVEQFDQSSFTVAAFAETLRKSNLGQMRSGCDLHLERAVTPNTRLGGHIVQGHVDGLGILRELRQSANNYYMRVELPQVLLDLCVIHGSICLDGVSLTIAQMHSNGFEVNIIEHTWQHTMFRQRQIGSSLNIECDILGKYILRFAQRGLLGGLPNDLPKASEFKGPSLKDMLENW